MTVDPRPELLEEIAQLFRKHGLRAWPEKVEKQHERFRASYDIVGSAKNRDGALTELAELKGVRKITLH